MKLTQGNGKTTHCDKCDKLICSNDKRYNVSVGVYCTYCGRVDSLYFGFKRWLKGVLSV